MQSKDFLAHFPIVVALDHIRSGHNVGSIFRTCDGLGVKQLVLGGISCAPPHKEIDKTALGATESVDWEHHWDILPALQNLQKKGFYLIGCDTGTQAKPIQVIDEIARTKGAQMAFIFGHEIRGISPKVQNMCNYHICLPQWGKKNAYNVAVAAGMILWHVRALQYKT